jgi:hypothetical protein
MDRALHLAHCSQLKDWLLWFGSVVHALARSKTRDLDSLRASWVITFPLKL